MNKPKFINPYHLNVGVRLFIAGLILWLGMTTGYQLAAMLFAAIAMKFPNPFARRSWKLQGFLHEGEAATEAEKALLLTIKGQNEEQLKAFKTEIQKLVGDAKSGLIDKAAFDLKMKDIMDKLEKFDATKFEQFTTKLAELNDALLKQGAKMKEIMDGGAENATKGKSFRKQLGEFLETEDWKEFTKNTKGKKVAMAVKIVDITNDYTGTSLVHITTRDPRVVDHPAVQRLNIRDLLTVSPTDLPYLAFTEVYDWDRNITMLAENTSLPESAFKVREATTSVKRVGTFIELSKNMLKSRTFISNHIATRLPALVRYAEDFQLLFGDGAGNNLTGIFKVADNFSTIINTTITGIAGDVASIATYNGGTQTLVNFTANQNINNGDNITFADADVAQYNDTFTAVVVGPRQIMIEIAYSAEADVSDWTFTVSSKFKNYQNAAQQIDVLKVAKTLVTRQEYACNGIVLHPDDATMIETLKGNDEHYIDVQRLENGILRIAGVPVVETTAMPSGKFAVGDWVMAAALLEFETLQLEFSESTEEKKKNTIVAIIDEQLLFPIYNKYMFVVGDFVSAIAAIQAAS